MIHIKPSIVVDNRACDDAIETARRAMPTYGVDFDSWVPLPVVYKVLGLYNTLFALCGCKKSQREDVSQRTRVYMASVAGVLYRYILVADPTYSPKLDGVVEVINKRCKGIKRRALLEVYSSKIKKLIDAEKRPYVQTWLKGLGFLVSGHDDSIAITHATMKLVLGADMIGVKDETFARCRDVFCKAFGLTESD